MDNVNVAQDNTNAAFDLQLFAEDAAEDAAEIAIDGTEGAKETDVSTDKGTDTEDGSDTDEVSTGGDDAKEGEDQQTDDLLVDYKPTMPEGFEVDEKMIGDFVAAAKEMGIKPEQADKMVGMGCEVAKVTAEKVIADINQQCETGYKQFVDSQNKQDIGKMNSLIEHYGGKEATGALHEAFTALQGFAPDSVPVIFKALAAAGKDYSDPSFKLGNPATKDNSPYPGAPKGLKFKK